MTDRDIAEETLHHLRHLRGQLDEWAPFLGQFKVSGLLAISRASKAARRGP